MDDLIEALIIFRKYDNSPHPTNCEHDKLWVHSVPALSMTLADATRLEELSFYHDEDTGWYSYRFGSC